MDQEAKATVLVYPGLEFKETEKSAGRYAKILGLPRRRFTTVINSARWKTPEKIETVEQKKTRIRQEIIDAAKTSGRPVGIVAVSGSGPLLTEVTHGLDKETVGAFATIASPLDAAGLTFDALPITLQDKLRIQSPVFVTFATQLMNDGMSKLTDDEIHRMLNVYGTRDLSVSPEYSGLKGANNQQFWTPYMPGKAGKLLSHAYNIARGLKTPQLKKFLTDKLQQS
jgi:hypothetical protein